MHVKNANKEPVIKQAIKLIVGIALSVGISLSSNAADWSINEIHYQYGNLKKAYQSGTSASKTNGTSIASVQHFSGWEYGTTYFFYAYVDYGQTDFEDNSNLEKSSVHYGEIYPNFSLGKITGNDLKFGPIKDIGLLAGLNVAPKVDTFYWLPGVRLSFDIPGFSFINLDLMAYIQNNGLNYASGVTINESNSWMADLNWSYPFTIGQTKWSVKGHIEYLHGTKIETSIDGVGTIDGRRANWLLVQPQLTLDVGDLWGKPGTLFAGLKYQYWNNKLGDKDTDESVLQALVVWRL